MVVTVVEHNYFKEQKASIITLAQTALGTNSHFTAVHGLAFKAYISPLLLEYCLRISLPSLRTITSPQIPKE